jgi:hypothetical protein
MVVSQKNMDGIPFAVGDRVLVTGGYDQHPNWLQGGEGYRGTIRDMRGESVVVELEAELTISSINRDELAWRIWGRKQDDPERIASPHGTWLLLRQGWNGSVWNEPTDRLHVVLCLEEPTIAEFNLGQIYGTWVEGHAVMRHVN